MTTKEIAAAVTAALVCNIALYMVINNENPNPLLMILSIPAGILWLLVPVGILYLIVLKLVVKISRYLNKGEAMTFLDSDIIKCSPNMTCTKVVFELKTTDELTITREELEAMLKSLKQRSLKNMIEGKYDQA